MRSFKDSDIFQLMDRGGAIANQLKVSGQAVNNNTIVNGKLETLDAFKKTYHETITNLICTDLAAGNILLVVLPMDKRFPAHIPFLKTTGGKAREIVDVSQYAKVDRDEDGNILKVNVPIDKLYAILVPAYLDLHLFYDTVALPSESIRWLSALWAKMFNKVLSAKKIFINNSERYEAFMYFAMRFCMKYYIQCPDPVIDSITDAYIGGQKSKYIQFVEGNLARRGIDLYRDWSTFAKTMFDNDVTNLSAFNTSGTVMDERLYLQSFDMYMGKDGAFVSLWSIPYFVYCLFATYNRADIFNDRAWQDVVLDERQAIPKMMNSFYKEL